MNDDKIKYLIDSNLEQVIVRLMEDKGMSMRDALDKVYASEWFELLNDKQTGLYYQSPNYNYELLCEGMQ